MLKMKQPARIYYSSEQRNLMWDRWQKGDSMRVIAGLFDRGHSSVQRILSETGGIRPRQRSRSRLALSLSEREEISRGVVSGQSIRSIAILLRRAPSTVSREIKRNGGRGDYRASKAEQAAWGRAHRRKTCKLTRNRALAHIVAKKLTQRWSPEQIAGWLKKIYPEDENYQVSHEIIYRSLYVQARGALKKELIKHLRSKRTMRHSRHGNSSGEGQGQIKDMISISERPASVEDRAVPGHWEGDLIVGSNDSYLATLVERHTR
jgi:IS30 family transposase